MTANYGYSPCPNQINNEPPGRCSNLYHLDKPSGIASSIHHQQMDLTTTFETRLRERIDVLNRIWLAYREEIFADQTDQIVWKSPRRLIMRSGCLEKTRKKRPHTSSPLMVFPEHLCKKPQHRLILLNFLQCNIAVTHMQCILEWLLKDLARDIEVAVFLLKDPPLVVALEPDGGPTISNALYQHVCWRITLFTGDIYAVDLTGAQYGWFDPVCSWQECYELRCRSDGSLRIGVGGEGSTSPLIQPSLNIPGFTLPRVDNYYVTVRKLFSKSMASHLQNLEIGEVFARRRDRDVTEIEELLGEARAQVRIATLIADEAWDTYPWEKILQENFDVAEQQRRDLFGNGVEKVRAKRDSAVDLT